MNVNMHIKSGAEKILEIAKINEYTIVSMKNDWKDIFKV